jgi:hypothetical protein
VQRDIHEPSGVGFFSGFSAEFGLLVHILAI